MVLGWRLIPKLKTHSHEFDPLGVVLSTLDVLAGLWHPGGERYDWGKITGFISVPLLIASGVIVIAGFLFWQSRNTRGPLIP